jgi:integrase
MGRGRPGTGVETLATSLRVSFTYAGKRHRETLGLKPTPANIKYATRLVADIKKQIATGTFDYATFFPESKQPQGMGNAITFKDLADKWIALHHMEHSTRIAYKNSLKVWIAAFGNRPIKSITPEDIRRVIAARVESGISAKTINNSLDPLRNVYEFATESGIPVANVRASIKRLPMQKTQPDPFSRNEMVRILAWMDAHAVPEVRAWYFVAFYTGLRPSEQCALMREDFKDGHLKIERAFVRGKMKSTKTRQVRCVSLIPSAERVIRDMLDSHTHDWVFPDKHGGPMNESTLRAMHVKCWVTCLTELGIRHRSPYHTRHTYATVNLMGGVNPAYIARQLGHSSLQLLLSTYSRWIDGADGGVEHAKVEASFAQ